MTESLVTSQAPAIFFGHGSPTTILSENDATRGWRNIASRFPKPKAIICVSAHWYTRGTHVTAMEAPKTIHDFGPLDPALFEIQYPAAGSPELAREIKDALAPLEVGLDINWGFDHGCWTVLSTAYPDADIPIVQLSIDGSKPADWHLELGKQLHRFRDQGVMIAGSGNIVHNLSALTWADGLPPYDWGVRFSGDILDAIKDRKFGAVCRYSTEHPDAKMAVPHPDHFLPLLYVLGASRDEDSLSVENDYFQFNSLSMTSLVFSGK